MNDDRNQGIWSKLTLKSGEQISIRPPELSDTIELVKLLSNIETEDESIPISESVITMQGVKNMILKMQRSNDVSLLLASADDTIVAFAEMEKDKFGVSNESAKLGIAVDRKYRRKGIGRTLIELLVEKARSSQIRKISLLVPINNASAISFYRRLGFTERTADSETIRERFTNPSTVLLMSRVVLPNISKETTC